MIGLKEVKKYKKIYNNEVGSFDNIAIFLKIIVFCLCYFAF
jgi:hypothetical protein